MLQIKATEEYLKSFSYDFWLNYIHMKMKMLIHTYLMVCSLQ